MGESVGMSGQTFDAFVSSQRTFEEYDFASKIQEKYWRARQKFLAKIEKKEDSNIVLSDTNIDAKLGVFRSIDYSCGRLAEVLENYQNALYVFANEENSLGLSLKEFSKHDKTTAGKVMSIVGKSFIQSSHDRIQLYKPLMRLLHEMETFHSRAVDDTRETVGKMEDSRSKYRASLLWMKSISEKLNPDVYKQLERFRRVQAQVRNDKQSFDKMKMDVFQKIDLLMGSRCNLLNQTLGPYQETLLDGMAKNSRNFEQAHESLGQLDIYEYEFKSLKQLNPLVLRDSPTIEEAVELTPESLIARDLLMDRSSSEDLLKIDDDDDGDDDGDRKSTSTRQSKTTFNRSDDPPPFTGQVGSANDNNDAMGDTDLLDDEQPAQQIGETKPEETLIDLLDINELDQIDNSSFFKSNLRNRKNL